MLILYLIDVITILYFGLLIIYLTLKKLLFLCLRQHIMAILAANQSNHCQYQLSNSNCDM